MPKRQDYRSAEAAEYRKLYKTAKWQRIRLNQLLSEPLCAMCKAAGNITPATICDHTRPHRGDIELFFAGPFTSLCKPHHDKTKQKEERTGQQQGSDTSGAPLDPRHPWNA